MGIKHCASPDVLYFTVTVDEEPPTMTLVSVGESKSDSILVPVGVFEISIVLPFVIIS